MGVWHRLPVIDHAVEPLQALCTICLCYRGPFEFVSALDAPARSQVVGASLAACGELLSDCQSSLHSSQRPGWLMQSCPSSLRFRICRLTLVLHHLPRSVIICSILCHGSTCGSLTLPASGNMTPLLTEVALQWLTVNSPSHDAPQGFCSKISL